MSVTSAAQSASRSISSANVIAWQGLMLTLPRSWNPVKLEGDYDSGQLLLADMHRPRLGIRWRKPRDRKFDAHRAVLRAMQDEVGQLAAEEARPLPMKSGRWRAPMHYTDSEPPGRDVWVGYSDISNRVVQIVHHSTERNNLLADIVSKNLVDRNSTDPTPWSIFELSCRTPSGFALEHHQLMAGDLSLTFSNRDSRLTVRQIAVAELALARMSLNQWLRSQQRIRHKHYRPQGKPIEARFGELAGLSDRSDRRRRFFWMRKLSPTITTCALHDTARDRLVLLESNNPEMIEAVASTVGWAWSAQEP